MSRFEYLQQCAKWAKGRMWKQKVKFETFTATDGKAIDLSISRSTDQNTKGGIMSRFEYLQQCAKWAKGRMWKQKAKVETFTATDGTTVNGWKVSYIGGWNEENHYSKTIGDYEEWWGRDEAVLSTKGILYVYSQTTHEIGSGRTETKQASTKKETRLRPLDTTNFGRKGVIVTMQDMIKILQAMGR